MDSKDLKFKIKKAMADRGIPTQKALAKLAELHPNLLSKWFAEEQVRPDTASLEKLSKVLAVPVSFFTGDISSPKVDSPVNLDAKVWIEIIGKVWATPFRMSQSRGVGQHIPGKPGEQDCFALQVEGDSMLPWYIPGELIVCRPKTVSLTPYSDSDDNAAYVPYERMSQYHNRDAVVEHEGDTMLKRLQIERTRGPMYNLWMTSTNPKYPKVKVHFGDEWRMQALVIRTEKPQIQE